MEQIKITFRTAVRLNRGVGYATYTISDEMIPSGVDRDVDFMCAILDLGHHTRTVRELSRGMVGPGDERWTRVRPNFSV